MEVYIINGVLAAVLIYLLIKKVRKDSADKPRRWDDDPKR
jgi:hypothetical protein